VEPSKSKKPPSELLRNLWPDIRELVMPRRGILIAGFFLMLINRASGLVLPASTKFLIDDVIGANRRELLLPLLLAVLGATLIQGVTSFA
jgi:ABC-type bacteriocin/lantibiotic exporter with double-glycine peptidase domain